MRPVYDGIFLNDVRHQDLSRCRTRRRRRTRLLITRPRRLPDRLPMRRLFAGGMGRFRGVRCWRPIVALVSLVAIKSLVKALSVAF